MSIIVNLLHGVIKKTRRLYENKYEKIGLSWIHVRRLKNLRIKGNSHTKFFNYSIRFQNRHELLHSIEEIFIKEIYKSAMPSHPGPLIFDCGANIGLSVIYFKKQYPLATIIAFEPDDLNYEILNHNIASQHLTGITVKKEAVWNKDTSIEFINEGSTSSKIDTSLHESSGKTSIVKATRLKDLIDKKIDFLKLDIEGAEYEVIKDIEDRLFHISNLFLEYHGTFGESSKLEEILQLLSRNQFRYYITEANEVYPTPFYRKNVSPMYDVQLNISCFRD